MIKFEKLNPDRELFFTSDIHYGHSNMVKGISNWGDTSGCRDFNTREEMNEALLNGILNNTSDDAIICNCGDVAFGGIKNIFNLMGKLGSRTMILTPGNHDHNIRNSPLGSDVRGLFWRINDMNYLEHGGFKFMMSHYPMVVWHQSHKEVPLAFGHVHGSNPGLGKSQDVGVDVAYKLFGEYRPFTKQEFMDIVAEKEVHLESHHNSKTN